MYSHNDDPVLAKKQGGLWSFLGKTERESMPAVVSFQTDKALGLGAGAFTLTVKAPVARNGEPDFYDTLVDDDWIDIVGVRGGKRFHIMRGLVESFSSQESTTQGRGTQRTITIIGKDHGAIFDKTKVWFNQFRAENVGNAQTLDIFGALNIGGAPNDTVRRLLFVFLETMAADPPRANWTLPSAMPGSGSTFSDTVLFLDGDFSHNPSRISVAQQFMDPNGDGVFALAQEWSDPEFCELYCDLVSLDGRYLGVDEECDVNDTKMAVIFRDRPFPTLRDGRASTWYRLPIAEVARQDIDQDNTGRGGLERYNAFFASPSAIQNLAASAMDLHGPLWDTDSIQRHGMRAKYVDSRYIADVSTLYTMAEAQRTWVMNVHALNPYLHNGTLGLGVFRPDIRIGTRVRVVDSIPERTMTYYVEQVSHSWSLGRGRTTLGVTRGWRGTESSYLEALQKVSDRYTLLPGNNSAPRAFSQLALTNRNVPE